MSPLLCTPRLFDNPESQVSTDPLTTKQRPRTPHEANGSYTLLNYIAYILYPPLYIAGPIITFNDFLWQVSLLVFPSFTLHKREHSYTHIVFLQIRRPQPRDTSPTSRASTVAYLVRFLFSLLTMEVIQHYMYVVAIKDSSAWLGDSPLELCMIGFWNLIIMWLKVQKIIVLPMRLTH